MLQSRPSPRPDLESRLRKETAHAREIGESALTRDRAVRPFTTRDPADARAKVRAGGSLLPISFARFGYSRAFPPLPTAARIMPAELLLRSATKAIPPRVPVRLSSASSMGISAGRCRLFIQARDHHEQPWLRHMPVVLMRRQPPPTLRHPASPPSSVLGSLSLCDENLWVAPKQHAIVQHDVSLPAWSATSEVPTEINRKRAHRHCLSSLG